MNYLLDTHAVIWFLNGDDKLSVKSKELIENQDNFKFDKGFKKFLDLIEDNGFEIIPISFDHALTVSTLDFIHRDPFDRLIISQALSDNLTIITKDKYIEKYDVKTIW